jgi:hypothetical protein
MHKSAVKKVVLEGVLDANDALAQANRERFDRFGTFVVNMMSSPGAGKTALLEHLEFDLEHFLGQLDAVNPNVPRILTSASTGQGVEEWCSWLRSVLFPWSGLEPVRIFPKGPCRTTEYRRTSPPASVLPLEQGQRR